MQVYLPVHQTARSKIVLDRIDTVRFYDKRIVHNIQHLDDSCRPDVPFCHAREKTVTSQIVKSVHIELAGDELMEERLGVVVLEDADGEVQCPVHLLVDTVHHQ